MEVAILALTPHGQHRFISVRLVVFVLTLLLAACWWIVEHQAPDRSIDIEAAQLQRHIAARLPRRSCMLGFACVTVSEPAVQLAEGSKRIGLAATVMVTLGKRQSENARIMFSGVPHYASHEGAFYLDDVQLDEMQLTGVAPEFAEVIKRRAPEALRQALRGRPIYSLRDDRADEAFAKLMLRDVQVIDGKVRVTFSRFAD